MNTADIATTTKTERIDRAMYLAMIMQEKAAAHALLVDRRDVADAEGNYVTEAQLDAATDRWVEVRRDLRDFLVMAMTDIQPASKGGA